MEVRRMTRDMGMATELANDRDQSAALKRKNTITITIMTTLMTMITIIIPIRMPSTRLARSRSATASRRESDPRGWCPI